MKFLIVLASFFTLFNASAEIVLVTKSHASKTVAIVGQFTADKTVYFTKNPVAAHCGIYLTNGIAESAVKVVKNPIFADVTVAEVKNPLVADMIVYVAKNPLAAFGRCDYAAALLVNKKK